MLDWNNDGKIDGKDRMQDYYVYSELSKDSSSGNRSAERGMTAVGGGLLLFGILIILIKLLGG